MLAYVFILIAVAVRFMPHPMAFTPVGAALLYFGARGSRRQLWIPLALLAASDVILTTMFYRYPFSWDHFVTWAWYAGMLGLGSTLKRDSGASADSAYCLDWLCGIFCGQQFRGVGRLEYVPADVRRVDDVL